MRPNFEEASKISEPTLFELYVFIKFFHIKLQINRSGTGRLIMSKI